MRIRKEATWRFVSIKVREDDIVCFTALESGKQDLEDVIALYDFVQELVDAKPMKYLIDFREHYVDIPPKVIAYIAKDPKINKSKIAEAIVVKSLPNRLLVNFYLNIKRPQIPAKAFNTAELAIIWLNSIEQAHETSVKTPNINN